MKDNKKTFSLISIFTLILALVCLFYISGLKKQIHSLENSIVNYQNTVYSQINRLSADINAQLEQQQSIVADSSLEVIDINADNQTAVLRCKVMPKEYNPDTTSAQIVFNDAVYDMTLNNGAFVTDIESPITSEASVTSVSFEDNGNVRAQKLNLYQNLRYQCLPQVYCRDDCGYSIVKGSNIYKFNGSIYTECFGDSVNSSGGFENRLMYGKLIAKIDDRQVWSEKMDISAAQHGDSYFAFETPVQQDFELSPGNRFELYAEYTDTYGFIYRRTLYDFTVLDNGQIEENLLIVHYTDEVDIYDKSGNPLYLVDREEYPVG